MILNIKFGYTHLIRVGNLVEWNPRMRHCLVPDESFIPHFNKEARVHTVGLTAKSNQTIN